VNDADLDDALNPSVERCPGRAVPLAALPR
jgi:hypothetical protein